MRVLKCGKRRASLKKQLPLIRRIRAKHGEVLQYDVIVFKEQEIYVDYRPELDISSCGSGVEQAKEMLKTAVRLFVEEAEKMGTLGDILEESRFIKDVSGRWTPPKLIATELVSI